MDNLGWPHGLQPMQPRTTVAVGRLIPRRLQSRSSRRAFSYSPKSAGSEQVDRKA